MISILTVDFDVSLPHDYRNKVGTQENQNQTSLQSF